MRELHHTPGAHDRGAGGCTQGADAPIVPALRWQRPQELVNLCRRLAVLAPVLVAVLACYAAALGYGAVQPPVADSEQPVVGWLEAHHLTTGLGTYSESNIITLDSGGRVAVRTVTWRPSGAVQRAYESEASWYYPRLSYANFVLTNSADGGRISLIPHRDIIALAGPPAHTYHYKSFTIMVWNHNLLADLGHPPSAVPGDIP